MNPVTNEGVELLDEASLQPRGSIRREWLLGIGLLLLIVVWGGWDWWRQETGLTNYRAGQRFAAAYKWESARDAFIAAGDFRDAAVLALQASANIGVRDYNYLIAGNAAAQTRWITLLRASRAVDGVAPDYGNNRRLLLQAERAVYSGALSGTVALRTLAMPPGLYRYGASGWTLLAGSDSASKLFGSGADGCLVYDAHVVTEDGGLASTRRLVVMRGAIVEPLDFDPTAFDHFACNTDGVIGWRYGGTDNVASDPLLARTANLLNYNTLTYQQTGRYPLAYALPAGWALLQLDTAQQRMVLGEYSAAEPDPVTVLYIANPNGNRVPAAVRRAVVQSAWLSPDGRYLLEEEVVALPSGKQEQHRLVLITIDVADSGRILLQADVDVGATPDQTLFSAQFVASGPYGGMIVIAGSGMPNQAVQLLDPSRPDTPIWSRHDRNYADLPQVLPFDDGLVLSWTSVQPQQNNAIYLDRKGKASMFAFDLRDGTYPASMQQSGNRLVYSWVSNFSGTASDVASGVSSLPLPANNPTTVSTISLYPQNGDGAAQSFNSGRPWVQGETYLAYIKDGQLWAMSYDGNEGVELEDGVTTLYDPTP